MKQGIKYPSFRIQKIVVLLFGCLIAFSLGASPPPLSSPDVSPESNSDPEYFGEFGGSAAVSAGGNASYNLPIELPRAAGGFTPELSISYNSNVQNGMLGLGWFLQGANSKITRCPKTYSQDGVSAAVTFTSEDRFCLDGHRLIAVNGTYGASGTEYRTESDSFAKITSLGSTGDGPSLFKVEYKNGLIKRYGRYSDARVAVQNGTTVRAWALSDVEDRAGNKYNYSHHKNTNQGESYPLQIRYSINASLGAGWQGLVRFVYEDRPDNVLHYQAGSRIRPHPKRLAKLKIEFDSQLVAEYRFSYEEIGLHHLSRLTRIEHCDDSGTCRKPVDLEWWGDGNATLTKSTLTVPYYNAISEYGTHSSTYGAPRWHDMNGDGKPDYVHVDPGTGFYMESSTYFEMLMSGPSGYESETWSTTSVDRPDNYIWADVDGDGRTDVVKKLRTDKKTRFEIAFARDSGFDTRIWAGHVRTGTGVEYQLLDMNGDRRLDMVAVESFRTKHYNPILQMDQYKYFNDIHVRLNTGSGFGAISTWATTIRDGQLIDMNGDGLPDVLRDDRYVRFNTGSGFGSEADFGSTGYYIWDSYYPGAASSYHDFNGDGLPDRRTYDSNGNCCVMQHNTGTGFTATQGTFYIPYRDIDNDGIGDVLNRSFNDRSGSSNINIRSLMDDQGNLAQTFWSSNGFGRQRFQQVVDFNGDGYLDYTVADTWVCKHVPSSFYGYYYSDWCETDTLNLFRNTAKHPHLLKAVETGLGRRVEFTYKPLTDQSIYTKGSGASLPEMDIQDDTYVVTRLRQSNGVGSLTDIRYTYEGLKRDYGGRGNLGFAKITANNVTTRTITATEYAQTFPYSSQPTRVEVRRSSDNRLLKTVETEYAVYGTVGAGPVFAYVDTRVTKGFDLGDGRLLKTSTTINNTVDAFGNVLDTVEVVEDHENGDTFKSQVLSTYNTGSAYYWRTGQLLSRVEKKWLNGANQAALDRQTDFNYHNSGLLRQTIREPGGGTGIALTKSISYDAFGNARAETLSGPGITSRTSTVTYTSDGRFPNVLTNAEGHQVTQVWDPLLARKTSETDANGQTTSWEYNSFGQQVRETRPDGTVTETRAYERSSGGPSNSAYYIETLTSGKAPHREFHDLLGRTLRVRSQSFEGYYANRDTQYDSRGRAYRNSEPYFDGDAIPWNTTALDHLDRPLSLTAADPVKSSAASYDGFTVSATDAGGRTTVKEQNAVGQVIAVTDDTGTRMEMRYDPAGNRIQVINAVGTAMQSTVVSTYDRLGRETSKSDPNHGMYTYTYNAAGEKLSEVSPKMAAANQSVTYSYDRLGRMTSRTEPEGATTWTYDNTSNGNLGLGQLHSESQGDFTRTYHYAAGQHGRLTGTTTKIGADSYMTSMSYDINGNIASETYPASAASPGGFNVVYSYNATGQLERVGSLFGGTVYYQKLATDAAGRTTEEWLGDGSLASQAYHGHSDRLAEQYTGNGSQTIQHFSYSYDSSGNMSSRSDQVHSLSEAFSYDDLDRLTSAQVSGGNTVNFGFDETGNITEKSDSGSPYLYNSPALHAVTSITPSGGGTAQILSYDSNGNLSTGSQMPSITWSSYNKPTQISQGGTTYTFAYGPDRQRYRKTVNQETTYYIGNSFERIDRATSTEYRHVIRANGRAILLRKSVGAGVSHQYIHRDHLGSVTALTDETTGAVLQRFSYDAWGKRRSATDWTSAAAPTSEYRGYTGHEHLDEVGLIHMNGRIYSPGLGRMLSPDPVTQEPENGQNYNRYTYAFNNPLKYTDPSGFVAISISIVWGGNGGGFGGYHSTPTPGFSEGMFQSQAIPRLIPDLVRYYFLTGDPDPLGRVRCELQNICGTTVDGEAGDNTSGGEPIAPAPVVGEDARPLSQRSGRVSRKVEYGDDGYHSYQIRGLICSTSSAACNSALADRVFAHVNSNDIPFTPDDLGSGRRELLGGNPIEHIEDIANRTSVNVTLDGHAFHPGDVTHRVHFENGNLYYDTIGTGTGMAPIFNVDVGIFLFQPGVESAVDEFGF